MSSGRHQAKGRGLLAAHWQDIPVHSNVASFIGPHTVLWPSTKTKTKARTRSNVCSSPAYLESCCFFLFPFPTKIPPESYMTEENHVHRCRTGDECVHLLLMMIKVYSSETYSYTNFPLGDTSDDTSSIYTGYAFFYGKFCSAGSRSLTSLRSGS